MRALAKVVPSKVRAALSRRLPSSFPLLPFPLDLRRLAASTTSLPSSCLIAKQPKLKSNQSFLFFSTSPPAPNQKVSLTVGSEGNGDSWGMLLRVYAGWRLNKSSAGTAAEKRQVPELLLHRPRLARLVFQLFFLASPIPSNVCASWPFSVSPISCCCCCCSPSVHLARPQTQHALNFASYHNAAVKLITSLECKNQTSTAHTERESSKHPHTHVHILYINKQKNCQSSCMSLHVCVCASPAELFYKS